MCSKSSWGRVCNSIRRDQAYHLPLSSCSLQDCSNRLQVLIEANNTVSCFYPDERAYTDQPVRRDVRPAAYFYACGLLYLYALGNCSRWRPGLFNVRPTASARCAGVEVFDGIDSQSETSSRSWIGDGRTSWEVVKDQSHAYANRNQIRG